MSDNVNKPAHYNAGEVETIDGIRAALGEGFADYCRGNVLKYVWRCGKKGDGVEDLRKAATYLQWAIEAMEGNCPVIPDSSDRKPIAIPAGWRELEPDEVPLATDMHEWMGGWYYRNDDGGREYKWHSSRHVRKIEPDEPKPLEIPDGYRELTADDFIVFGDLYDDGDRWLGYTYDPASHKNFKYRKGFHKRVVRKIETAKGPEYREPTKADIAHGPIEVEACTPDPDTGERIWRKRSLVAIYNYGSRFGVEHPNNASEIVNYMEARIKIETANPSETPNGSTWIPKVGDKVRVAKDCDLWRYGVIEDIHPKGELFLFQSDDGRYQGWLLADKLHLVEAAS